MPKKHIENTVILNQCKSATNSVPTSDVHSIQWNFITVTELLHSNIFTLWYQSVSSVSCLSQSVTVLSIVLSLSVSCYLSVNQYIYPSIHPK